MEERKEELRRQLVILGISLVSSFVFWFLPFWTGTPYKFTVADQFLMSLTSFIALTMLDIVWIEGNNLAQQRSDYKKWTIMNDADKELNNIRTFFGQVVQGAYNKKDLFVNQYMGKLQRLAGEIKHTAEKNELRVEANHLLSVDDVLAVFEGDRERIWRYTWPISSNERVLGHPAWRRYFEETANMLHQRQLNGIHILVIVPDLSTLSLPRVTKLLDFFHAFKGMECRIVLHDQFVIICGDNDIPRTWLDFGIYAKRLLFITDTDGSGNGLWTKDDQIIQKYVGVFDVVWQTKGISKTNPSVCNTLVTLAELMDFDDNQPE